VIQNDDRNTTKSKSRKRGTTREILAELRRVLRKNRTRGEKMMERTQILKEISKVITEAKLEDEYESCEYLHPCGACTGRQGNRGNWKAKTKQYTWFSLQINSCHGAYTVYTLGGTDVGIFSGKTFESDTKSVKELKETLKRIHPEKQE